MKIKSIILSTAIAGIAMTGAAIAQDGPPNGVPYTSVPAIPIKKCLNMGNMFANASKFGQNISSWCVGSVEYYDGFASNSTLDESPEFIPPFGTEKNCV